MLRQQFAPFSDRQINNYSWVLRAGRVAGHPNLKLTLSLRLDRNSNETCTNCFSHLGGDFIGGISHNVATPYNQSVLVGQSGLFSGWSELSGSREQDLPGHPHFTGRTVVRGGAGIFSDLYPAQISTNVLSNPPNVAIWTIASTGPHLPIAPGVANGAFAQAAANNAALVNGFASGGTLASIQGGRAHF